MLPPSAQHLWWLTLVGVVVSAEGWLWFGGSGSGSPQLRKAGTEQGKNMPPVQYYRPMESAQWVPQFTYEGPPVPPMTFAMPVAVPVTQQGGKNMQPQPVQLVPCLCPITREDPQQVQQLQQQPQQVQQPVQQSYVQQQPQQQSYVQQQPQSPVQQQK